MKQLSLVGLLSIRQTKECLNQINMRTQAVSTIIQRPNLYTAVSVACLSPHCFNRYYALCFTSENP